MKQHVAETLMGTLSQEWLNTAKLVSYAPGDYIKRAGVPFNHFCILAKGTSKLLYDDAASNPLILDLYHTGDFFGEMEVIDMHTEDRSIVALTDCKVYQFTAGQFLDMWNSCSAFSRYILCVLCERLIREGNDKINAECMFLREKVFRIIQQHLNEENYFPYTKDILAEMAGTSMRSLNRALSDLKQMGLISLSSAAIRLKT